MTETKPDPAREWWTTTDIAEFLGVQVGTISSYRNRGQMPEPDDTIGRSPVWKPERILAWHDARPRPGVGGRPEAQARDGGQYAGAAFLTVSTATSSQEEAQEIAKGAVESRLAAGAQITGPAVSVFWHHGKFGTGEEWRLALFTRSERFSDLEAFLKQAHSWSNPEITAVPIVAGSQEYLEWIRGSVDPPDGHNSG